MNWSTRLPCAACIWGGEWHGDGTRCIGKNVVEQRVHGDGGSLRARAPKRERQRDASAHCLRPPRTALLTQRGYVCTHETPDMFLRACIGGNDACLSLTCSGGSFAVVCVLTASVACVFLCFLIVRLFDNLARRRRCRAHVFLSKTKGALRGTMRYQLYRQSPTALGVARVLRISRYVRL